MVFYYLTNVIDSTVKTTLELEPSTGRKKDIWVEKTLTMFGNLLKNSAENIVDLSWLDKTKS